jgi:mRNA interferase RelE/StbE
MYEVTITARAERELKRLDRAVKNRVVKAVLELAADPRPAGCLKVKSEEGVRRIRVGDRRVGYHLDDPSREVTVIRSDTAASFTTNVRARPLYSILTANRGGLSPRM